MPSRGLVYSIPMNAAKVNKKSKFVNSFFLFMYKGPYYRQALIDHQPLENLRTRP